MPEIPRSIIPLDKHGRILEFVAIRFCRTALSNSVLTGFLMRLINDKDCVTVAPAMAKIMCPLRITITDHNYFWEQCPWKRIITIDNSPLQRLIPRTRGCEAMKRLYCNLFPRFLFTDAVFRSFVIYATVPKVFLLFLFTKLENNHNFTKIK